MVLLTGLQVDSWVLFWVQLPSVLHLVTQLFLLLWLSVYLAASNDAFIRFPHVFDGGASSTDSQPFAIRCLSNSEQLLESADVFWVHPCFLVAWSLFLLDEDSKEQLDVLMSFAGTGGSQRCSCGSCFTVRYFRARLLTYTMLPCDVASFSSHMR